MHYNFLPAWDTPTPHKPHVPPYVFLTEALELCHTISDVEDMLSETNRDGGMLLFAVDGKNNEFALFDCLCSKYYRRQSTQGWIVGTNHYCACDDPTLVEADKELLGTLSRFEKMANLIQTLSSSKRPTNLPADLIQILADNEIERREKDVITV